MIQRYSVWHEDISTYENNDGDWVKWEDVEDLILDSQPSPLTLEHWPELAAAKRRGSTTELDFDTGNVYEVSPDGTRTLMYNELLVRIPGEDNS